VEVVTGPVFNIRINKEIAQNEDVPSKISKKVLEILYKVEKRKG